MNGSWIRGVSLVISVLGLTACGGPVEEEPAQTGSVGQELRQCDASGNCGTNEVCRNNTCYPCRTFPQYCGVVVN